MLGTRSAAPLSALAALAMAMASTPASAVAQAGSPRDAAAARALFQEGVGCVDHRDWSCAADRFERAYALRPSPVIAYNLGHAMLELGRLVEAAEMLHRATRDESASAQVRADARRMVDALTPRIGRLTLHVRGPREDVTIRVGEHELPEALHGTASPIDPGEHTIEAVRGGEVVASTRVEVADGAQIEAELTIPAPAVVVAEVRPPVDDTEPDDAADRILAEPVTPAGNDDGLWIGLGVGGGVLAVGAAILIGVLVAEPRDATPFGGNLGIVEVGR